MIVAPGADVEVAAERCAATGFAFAGQTCISVQRVFVHETLADDFLERFTAHVEALATGDPADERTVVGPLIDHDSRDRILGWIEEATRGGASLVTGGAVEGGMLQPTVVTDTTPEMSLASREVFGPVVVVEPYATMDEAIARANETPYGLQAGIFTGDVAGALAAAPRLRFGSVLINETPAFRADQMPYSGTRASGNSTEGPRYTVREMTVEQLVVVQLPTST